MRGGPGLRDLGKKGGEGLAFLDSSILDTHNCSLSALDFPAVLAQLDLTQLDSH
jgi:hypothetical protein